MPSHGNQPIDQMPGIQMSGEKKTLVYDIKSKLINILRLKEDKI